MAYPYFEKVKITQLETKGSLKLNGVDVALNQEISWSDVYNGKLVYTPVKDAYGNLYSNFKFKLKEGINYGKSNWN